MNRRLWRPLATLVALLILVAVAKFGTSGKPSVDDPRATTAARGDQPFRTGQSTVAPEPSSTTRSPETALARLVADPSERAEIETTLARIASNGPYPHARDGIVFANREGRLPRHPRGYYREYTVETPGAPNRGARRIVRGGREETYYTRDHYGTFIRIDEGSTR